MVLWAFPLLVPVRLSLSFTVRARIIKKSCFQGSGGGHLKLRRNKREEGKEKVCLDHVWQFSEFRDGIESQIPVGPNM